jgi:hypothetical protein
LEVTFDGFEEASIAVKVEQGKAYPALGNA